MIYTQSLTKLKDIFGRANASGEFDLVVAYIPAENLLPIEQRVLLNCGAGFEEDQINGKPYFCLAKGPNLEMDRISLVMTARAEAKANPNKRILVERLAA